MANIQATAGLRKYFQELVGKDSPQYTNAGQVGQGIENNPKQGKATFSNGNPNDKDIQCSHLSYGKPGTKKTFTAFWDYNTPLDIDLLATGMHVKVTTGKPKKYKIQNSWNTFFKEKQSVTIPK